MKKGGESLTGKVPRNRKRSMYYRTHWSEYLMSVIIVLSDKDRGMLAWKSEKRKLGMKN